MAKKTKSVLDYDPLAWLNEDGDAEQENSDESAQKEKPTKKKSTKKKAATKKKSTAKKASVKKKAVTKKKAATKKKSVSKKKVTTSEAEKMDEVKSTETNETNTSDDEGFGFFSEETSDLKSDASDDLEGDGFGFFTDPNQTQTESETLSEDEGFGFFAETSPASTVDDSEDEGFGFFDQDDSVPQVAEEHEPVNQEVLEVEKEDIINLGSELSLKTISPIKETLEQCLNEDIDIVINADELIKIDTAGLQMLYSLKEALSKTGHHIKWVGTSTVINDSAEIIGMPVLAPKSKDACYGFFDENLKDAPDGSSGFF